MTAAGGGSVPCRRDGCFRLRHDGTTDVLACLGVDLARARAGEPLRWASEARDGGARRGPGTPWRCPAGLAVRIEGLRIGLRATTPAALAALRAQLPPGCRPVASRTVDRVYSLLAPRGAGLRTLYADRARVARVRRSRSLLDTFESDLQLHVADHAVRSVFVHAGVVGWRGRALLLPGRSGAGKTTLVAELIRAGATYYSDEYAVLDDRGRVRPYARLLALRRDGTFRRRRRRPEAFGARAGTRALPVGLVVASRYRLGARWRLRRLSPGEGALALMANTVSARREPARALAALQAVVARAPVFRGVRGEAREAARALLARFDRLAPAEPGVSRPPAPRRG